MMERIADKKYVLENYTNRITCKGLDSLLSRVPVPRKQKNGAYKRDRRRPFTPESQLQLMSLLFEKPFDLSTTHFLAVNLFLINEQSQGRCSIGRS